VRRRTCNVVWINITVETLGIILTFPGHYTASAKCRYFDLDRVVHVITTELRRAKCGKALAKRRTTEHTYVIVNAHNTKKFISLVAH
jgi:hypothetical protein